MRKLLVAALLLAGCGDGMIIQPAQAAVVPGGLVQFVTNAVPAVWTADGGQITQSGLYTAPPCGAAGGIGTFRVVATAGDKTASATVLVQEAVLSVSVTPATVTLQPGQTQQFTATVTSTCGTAVSTARVTAPATSRVVK